MATDAKSGAFCARPEAASSAGRQQSSHARGVSPRRRAGSAPCALESSRAWRRPDFGFGKWWPALGHASSRHKHTKHAAASRQDQHKPQRRGKQAAAPARPAQAARQKQQHRQDQHRKAGQASSSTGKTSTSRKAKQGPAASKQARAKAAGNARTAGRAARPASHHSRQCPVRPLALAGEASEKGAPGGLRSPEAQQPLGRAAQSA